jgi:hypothetical protein
MPKIKIQSNRTKISKSAFPACKEGIKEGKFVLPVGSKFFVQRIRNGSKIISSCILKEILEGGNVTMWDENVTQFFSFNLNDMKDIVVKCMD